MRAFITGASGFVGNYLCRYLLAHTDWELLGTVYPDPVESPQPDPRLRLIQLDLRDPQQVKQQIEDFAPEAIVHLAAISFVPSSFADPWNTLDNNIRAQLNVLEAMREAGGEARVLVIGSNEEYGKPHADELPVVEETPLRPLNPYAVSKVAQDFLGLQYHLTYGIEVVRLRPFNHTGPGQSPRFVLPAFASQVARIEAGLQEPVVRVGNLDVARDFTDVRDIVAAYHLALVKGEAGEVYNLASGSPQSIRGLLEMLLSLSIADIHVEVDPSRYRPADAPVVYGSADKFRRHTGWEPHIPIEQTVEDVLTYWREQVRKSAGVQVDG